MPIALKLYQLCVFDKFTLSGSIIHNRPLWYQGAYSGSDSLVGPLSTELQKFLQYLVLLMQFHVQVLALQWCPGTHCRVTPSCFARAINEFLNSLTVTSYCLYDSLTVNNTDSFVLTSVQMSQKISLQFLYPWIHILAILEGRQILLNASVCTL